MTSGMKTLPVIAGAYDVFKRSFAAMVARAHCEGAPGILQPEDVAKVVVREVRSRRPRSRYRVGLSGQSGSGYTPIGRRCGLGRIDGARCTCGLKPIRAEKEATVPLSQESRQLDQEEGLFRKYGYWFNITQRIRKIRI
jgi:hypothetical protein